MEIVIRNSDNAPIYEQIFRQIKDNIASGKLKEGDMLPSIRLLAKDLRISVITTKRAYDELEKGGYIYTVAAKGSFVAGKNRELIREENLVEIEKHIQKISLLAHSCELSENDIVNMIKLCWEENNR